MTAENFIETFLGGLARDDFFAGQTFEQYLSADHGGDEKNIVDLRVSQALILALGYSDAEYTYDNSIGKRRPDFVVRIAEYPKPCFVIEDKKSSIHALEQEALAQLEGYMRSLGVSRGMLCNGNRLLAYELHDPVPVLIANVDLRELVARWRGEGNLFSNGEKGLESLDDQEKAALKAFYNRFSRSSYAGVGKLVHDLTHDSWGKPHKMDGSTFAPPFSSHNPDFLERLIEQTRAIIEEIEFDVSSQLTLRLEEFKNYQDALERLPSAPNEKARELIFKTLQELRNEYALVGIEDIWPKTQNFVEAQLERFTERDMIAKLERDFIEARKVAFLRNPEEINHKKKSKKKQKIDTESQENSLDAALPEQQAELLAEPKPVVPDLRVPTEAINQIARLQNLVASYHDHRDNLLRSYRDALGVRESYSAWISKVATIILKTDDEKRLHREFSAQTAYVLVVRMLLVRILEDKHLINRVFTNGGVTHWFKEIEPYYLKYAQGKGTQFLLEMAYSGAQHIYRHFYSERLLYDWYTPDRNLVIRILHRFAQFDLGNIDQDVIGHLYSRYVEDKHKHESGMYYTPPMVVDYILDRIGYSGLDAVEQKRIIDPACGSGTFLVKAANRIVQAFKKHHKGKIPASAVNLVLETVQEGVYGLDLNPFACYLAETNLLIQVLDPIKTALDANQEIHLPRFKIFNTDTLKPEASVAAIAKVEQLNTETETLNTSQLPEVERVKVALGKPFDYVVANPPYVRADEGGEGLKEYRRQIKEEHPLNDLREACKMKWDLFVPFVALGWKLLAPNGTLGMITSSAIETVPYTESIRELLTKNTQIKELAFFPGVRLFQDAVVENTVFVVQNTAPTDKNKALRRWFGQPQNGASLESVLQKSEQAVQKDSGIQVWRQTQPQKTMEGMVRLEDVCYVSKGMVLNSHERHHKGEFKKEDLLSPNRDAKHPVPYVEGKDIDGFEITDLLFLEYGSNLRAPKQISRSTFPQLYDRKKLIAQRSISSANPDVSQVILDDGKWNTEDTSDFLRTNESAVMFLLWDSLKGIKNDSIPEKNRVIKENDSKSFSLEFLGGVLNSEWITNYLRKNRRHDIHIFPDDFKALPIPSVSSEQQKPIVKLVQELNALGLGFFRLRRSGWTIKTAAGTCEAPAIVPEGVSKIGLARAAMLWGFTVQDSGATLSDTRLWQDTLLRGRNGLVLTFAPSTSEEAKKWLLQQFKLCGLETYATLEARGFEIPSTPAEAEKALRLLEKQEQKVVQDLERFKTLRQEVNVLVEALYP